MDQNASCAVRLVGQERRSRLTEVRPNSFALHFKERSRILMGRDEKKGVDFQMKEVNYVAGKWVNLE